MNEDRVPIENKVEEETFGPKDTRCGVGGWRPEWLQIFARIEFFLLAYGLLGMNEGAMATYNTGVITTLERRFKLPSAYMGMTISMWDVGTTVPFILISYLAGKRKIVWIARCTIIATFSCFVMMLPHIILGPGTISESANSTSPLCKAEPNPENCDVNNEGAIALSLLCLGNVLTGIGTSAYFTLGAAYLDDNCSKNRFPFYLGVSIFLRLFGPPLGLYMASYYTSIFIDSNVTPSFDETDSRWIGAWYRGYIGLGIFELVITIALVLFPRILPQEAKRRKESPDRDDANKNTRIPSLKDFKETMIRIITNPIILLNTISSSFFMFALDALGNYLPKYLETQFKQPASVADKFSGVAILASTTTGVLVSGAIISRFKPSPRVLIGLTVFSDLILTLTNFSYTLLGCDNDLVGSYNSDGSFNITSSCNLDCDCGPSVPYTPVCSQDGAHTFYSPCHAGCEYSTALNTNTMYSNCSCIENGTAFDGACPIEYCSKKLYIFLVLFCIAHFFQTVGRTGNAICQYRAVKPEDKSISLGFSAFIFAACVHIPSPIVAGKILDSACIVWGETCGVKGNCWLYDGESLRYLLDYTLVVMLGLATVADSGLWYYVGPLQIYEKEEKEVSEMTENSTAASQM